MPTNEKINSELRDYINKGYEILMNNIDEKAQSVIDSIMKLSIANSERPSFQFKQNVLIGVLEEVKDDGEL